MNTAEKKLSEANDTSRKQFSEGEDGLFFQINELNKNLSKLSEEHEILKREYASALASRIQAQHALQMVMTSPSWKITEPLRFGKKVVKKLRNWYPYIRVTTLKPKFAYMTDLTDSNNKYSISGNSPAIHFQLQPNRLGGTATLCYYTSESMPAYLSFDTGKGFVDEFKIAISLEAGTNRCLIQYPSNTVGIQVIPIDSANPFRFSILKIKLLGHIESIVHKTTIRVQKSGIPFHILAKKGLITLKNDGFQSLINKMKGETPISSYGEWIKKFDTLSDEDLLAITALGQSLNFKPKFSIILPTYNTPERWLRFAIDSILKQTYTNWELCIADDASTSSHVKNILEEYKIKDNRIKVKYREKNGHISACSQSALELATGDFIGFLDHDDELRPHALFMMADEINRAPDANLIYSDEDKITEEGLRHNPYFKCDWNRELFLQQNFICHFTVIRKSIIENIGGFRLGFEGSQDWDLFIRAIDSVDEKTILHIPHILYHWRACSGSTAQASSFKPYTLEAGRKAVSESLQRRGIDAKVSILENIAHFRVQYKLKTEPLVSIIIPTKDMVDVLSRCIDSIKKLTSYKNYEIIILDNNSNKPETFAYFDKILKQDIGQENCKVVKVPGPFNFSRINNEGVKHTKGSYLAFLNNDLEIISPDWLTEMVSNAQLTSTGCVGAQLWYPNNLLQHAGVILGIGGVAGHNLKGRMRGDVGYFNKVILSQEFSAVTAACLVTRRELFEKIGGFDEENLAVAFNDVDFCLRLRELGLKVIYTPYAALYHHESISRGYEHSADKFNRFQKEIDYMKTRWKEVLKADPYYNPNLTIISEDYQLAFPPRVKKAWVS